MTAVPYLPDLLRDPPEAESMMERAFRTLKREIIELRRPPGARFSEPAVAQALGLSKTPVREALARLHREGLVTPMPRTGYVVSPITLRDARDLCDMRTLLQTEAACLSAERGLDPDAARRLRELTVDDHLQSVEVRLRANYEFEAIIANASRNARLAQSVIGFLDELERIARLAMRASGPTSPERREQRLSITEAILAADAPAAQAAMRARTLSATKEIMDALTTSPAILDASIAIS